MAGSGSGCWVVIGCFVAGSGSGWRVVITDCFWGVAFPGSGLSF